MSKKEMSKKLSKDTPSSETASAETNNGLISKIKQRWWLMAMLGLLSLGVLGSTLKYLDEDAKAQIAKRSAATPLKPHEESLLNAVNPFLPAPSPTATPQLTKEYIYAGSRLLAVEDANANASAPADLAIWRPSTGYWWVMGSANSQQVGVAWGVSSDKTVPGDYDGDGKTDFSVYRADNPATPENECASGCNWYIQNSSNGALTAYNFGLNTDELAPADYDGDGRTDPAVYRNGTWYILKSSDAAMLTVAFGAAGDKPVAADYDGDGKADPAVWRDGTSPNSANFYILRSSSNQFQSQQFGTTGDVPVPADYDGDGKADFALRRGASWVFIYSTNANNTQTTIAWQSASDKAVPNDYDGDGKVDIAVWRGTESSPGAGDVGKWFIRQSSKISTAQETRQESWGTTNDIPVPAFYRR
ncbi:MAG: VCBS repeat-containing protein [Pyrinomonadaceae bacterium]|nr:VCBS repeat-containing protein [Pyrinomonadaceae bacterium]